VLKKLQRNGLGTELFESIFKFLKEAMEVKSDTGDSLVIL